MWSGVLVQLYKLFFQKNQILVFVEFLSEWRKLPKNLDRLQSTALVLSPDRGVVCEAKAIGLKAFYVPRFMALPLLWRTKAEVLLTSTTSLPRLPGVDRMVYFFHSLISTHQKYAEGSFDNYDLIYCPGDYHRRELRRREELMGIPPRELVVTGYPYLTHLSKTKRQLPRTAQPVALIGPTWGTGSLLREQCFLKKITEVLAVAGYLVFLRPHPMSLVDPVEFGAISNLGGRVKLDTNYQDDSLFLSAEILVGDWSGLLMEYSFVTGRVPLVHHGEKKLRNSDWEKYGLPVKEDEFFHHFSIDARSLEVESLPDLVLRKLQLERKLEAQLIQYRNELLPTDEDSCLLWKEALENLVQKKI